MSITRSRLSFERNFVQVPNAWMRDARISRRARGLLAEIMTHDVGWKLSAETLQKNGPEGRDAIRNALAELEQAGYLERDIVREGTKFAGVNYHLSDPFAGEAAERAAASSQVKPAPDNPAPAPESGSSPEEPSPGKPGPDNPQLRTPLERTRVKEGQGDTLNSLAPSASTPEDAWGDLAGGAHAVPEASTARPDRCPFHQLSASPPPCGACKEARLANERRLRDAQHEETVRERELQAAAVRERQRAAAECALCDDEGYLNGRPCYHDPQLGERISAGAAKVRAALRGE